jgi:hypothetical protein
MAAEEDSAFEETPQEYFEKFFTNTGYCDAQSILPRDGRYVCHCTCGSWDTVAEDRETGLELAREHTRAITERELARLAG